MFFKLKTCFICGSPDHFKVNCPERQVNSNGSQQGNQRTRNGQPRSWSGNPQRDSRQGGNLGSAGNTTGGIRDTIPCSFCGRPGHLMKDCSDFSDFMRNLVSQNLN